MANKLYLRRLWILLYIYNCLPVKTFRINTREYCSPFLVTGKGASLGDSVGFQSNYRSKLYHHETASELAVTIGTTYSFDCNFDDGFCNWRQDNQDDFNWSRLSGGTQTPNTGPDFDHTSGEGFYVYIDTSEAVKNKKARLISPTKGPGKYCFSLWYYMYGEHVRYLKISKKEGKNAKMLFKITGEQEQKWIVKQRLIDTNRDFEIVIEGRVTNNDKHDLGDIAIDDIVMFSSRRCPTDCGDPVLHFGKANSKDIVIGSIVQITCHTGYEITGQSSIVCQANGTWNGRLVCHPVDCRTPILNSRLIVNTSEGTTYNMTVTLDCIEGFTLFGNAYVICQADGNWTTQPTCVLNNCSDPTPKSGMVNSTRFQYGSVLNVTCIRVYKLTGNPLIICQANLTWTDSPVCDQIDCGTRNITNGLFNASLGTIFGKTATQSCDTGYTLTGEERVTCFEDGWNGTLATCSIVDCSVPFLTSGTLAEFLNGTTYNKSAILACVDGYTMTGDASVTCQADGNWTALPNCTITDCSVPFLTNGILAEFPNGTTYNKSAVLACVDGYTMTGDASVTCQADGNWTALPNCIIEDSAPSTLIAAYVTVTALALVPAILLIVYIWRKRHPQCAESHDGQHIPKMSPSIQFPNKTYEGHGLKTVRLSKAGKSLPPDEQYVSNTEESQVQAANNVYYNLFDVECTIKSSTDHQYDHTKYKLKPLVDMTYSHVPCKEMDTKWKSSNDIKPIPYKSNESLRADAQSENDTYDHLNINNVTKAMKPKAPITVNEEQESDYDHAKAGGKDPEALVQDDYSHLNDMKIYRENTAKEMRSHDQCEYSNVIESTSNMKMKDGERKAAYEQPIGHTPHYFVLEAEDKNTPEDDRTYCVLEAEEKREENNEPCNHDYFVLEKTGSA